MSVLYFAFQAPVLRLLGTSSDTVVPTQAYLQIVMAFGFVLALQVILPSLLRAEGKIKEAVIGMVIGTVMNIILDPVFILLLNQGVAGAAWATVTGNVFAVIYYLTIFLRRKTNTSIQPKYFQPSRRIIFEVMKIGLPASIAQIIMSFSIPGIPWFADVHNLTLKHFGLPEETVLVAAPFNVDDIKPWVKKAAEQDDAIMMTLVNNQDTANAVLARKELGITAPFIVEGMALTPESLGELGAAGEGILVASLFPAADSDVPGQQKYMKSMRDSGFDRYIGDKSQMSWMAFDLLHYALLNTETVTRESVLAALQNVKDYTGGGITPPLNFSEPSGPSANYLRLYNWTYYPSKIENGKIVSAEKAGAWALLPTDIPKSDAPWEDLSDEDSADCDETVMSGEGQIFSTQLIGAWDAVLDSPMGPISIVFEFTETPDGVKGSAVTGGENVPLTRLSVNAEDNGDECAVWEAEVEKPLKLHLKFKMTIHENVMDGHANAGIILRKAKVKGTRR